MAIHDGREGARVPLGGEALQELRIRGRGQAVRSGDLAHEPN
jgi:hypothetical protein